MNKQEMLCLLAAQVAGCQKCKDLAETRIQTVFGRGEPETKVVLLGEAPGRDEDKEGLAFVGRAGQLLNNILSACELEHVYILNILKCRPPNNRVPTPEESANCRPFLDLQLKVIRPKYIVCLGATAAQKLLDTQETIGRLRGKWFEIEKPIKAKVLATYHPAFLLRNPAAKEDVWNDLQLLLEELNAT
jgi:uracil-DNA glycosylase